MRKELLLLKIWDDSCLDYTGLALLPRIARLLMGVGFTLKGLDEGSRAAGSRGGGGCLGNIEPALRRGPARTISQLSFAAVLAAFGLFLAISVGCAGTPTSNPTPTPIPTPTPTPDPQTLLDQAIGQLQPLN